MPSVVNGIGTWYWGKSDVHERTGTCDICGQRAVLKSYDTTLFVVVFFVPVIPLGRKRVLDQCSRCSQHRVMKLRDWRALSDANREVARKQLEAEPWNAEHVQAALQVAMAFRDESLLEQARAAIAQWHAGDASLHVAIGNAWTFFGRHEQAVEARRSALAIADDPQVREHLSVNLIRLLRLDEARPLVQHVLDDGLAEKHAHVLLLVEGYQHEGRHADALTLLDAHARAFPALVKEKQVRKLRKISEKDGGRGRRVKSAELARPAGARHSQRRLAWIIPVVIAAVVLLSIVGGYAAASASAAHSLKVHVVDGLSVPYEVEIAGERRKLVPGRPLELLVDEGDVTARPVDDALGLEPATVSYRRSFWSRPFASQPVLVLNPDRAAVVAVFLTRYSSSTPAAGEEPPPPQVYFGESHYALDDVDYPFGEFPAQIEMSRTGGEVVKRRSAVGASTQEAASLVGWSKGREAVAQWAEIAAARDPDNEDLLGILATVAPDAIPRVVEPHLDDRPVRAVAHRWRQIAAEMRGELAPLVPEYEALLAEAPDDPARLYLLGRVVEDRARSRELFGRAAAAEPPSGHAHFALAYDLLSIGHFEPALAHAREAARLVPGSTGVASVLESCLLATGHVDEVLAGLEAEARRDPEDLDVVTRQIELLASKGDAAKATVVSHAFLSRMRPGLHPDTHAQLAAYVEAVRQHAEGRDEKLATLAPATSSMAFMAAITKGDGATAAQLASKVPLPDAGVLLLASLASGRSGDAAKAAELQATAVETLRAGASEGAIAADILEGKPVDDATTLTDLPLDVDTKRIVLVAAAQVHPKHRDAWMALAGKLLFDPAFPRVFLRSFATPATPSAG